MTSFNDIIKSLQVTPLVQNIRNIANTPLSPQLSALVNSPAISSILYPVLQAEQASSNAGKSAVTSFGNIMNQISPAIAKALAPVTPKVQQVKAAVTTPKVITAVTPKTPTQSFVKISPATVQNKEGRAPIVQQPTSNSNYDQLLAQAKETVRPYYEQLLANSNWNVDEAKKKLEEDYQLGKRSAEASSDESMKTLFNETIPQEQIQTANDLNKRGLLYTPQGGATQLTGKLSTGETISPTNPTLTQSYGGLGGRQIGNMYNSQQARAEAIGRALSQREAELQLPVTQGTREQNQQQLVNTQQNTEAQREAAGTLAGQQYANQTGLQNTALGSIYSG